MKFCRLLGIDVGSQMVGVAQSFDGGPVQHLATWKRPQGEAERLLLESIEREGVDGLVAGLPLLADGSLGEQAENVLQFCRRLRRRTRIPIVLVDESGSSLEAKERLGVRGREDRKLKKRSGKIDGEAAKIILTRFLSQDGIGFEPLESFLEGA